ncbi:M24 family metallopeptidase [Rhodococcus sp. NPDC127530]|uniref:M24 family metallopeptidase n=1 Tax=unclassified Rhodococcus (in: high G+C Gram-positive bacteria) TaxID=192944 RepID=UPI0036250CD8
MTRQSASAPTVVRNGVTTVSNEDLERRWRVLREEMERQGIDVLLAQGNNDFVGGYVRYLSDYQPWGGFTTTVVFTRDAGTALVTTGNPADMDTFDDGTWRGVDRVLTAPSFSTINYSVAHDEANVVEALKGFDRATVGVVGSHLISAATLGAIRRAYPRIRIVDASDHVDRIKAIKSSEEQALLRQTARTQDDAMLQVIDQIRPGMLEREVAIIAQQIVTSLGSSQGLFVAASGNSETPATGKQLSAQNRVIGEGDMVHILIESNGPSGLYTHMTRTVVLGTVPDELSEELEFALKAQAYTLDRLRPGAAPAEIWEDFNAFMRDNGRPEERRLYSHGQGFDIVERPLIRPEETLTIEAGMNIAVHPLYLYRGYVHWVCSNFLITADGVEQLNQLPTAIYER